MNIVVWRRSAPLATQAAVTDPAPSSSQAAVVIGSVQPGARPMARFATALMGYLLAGGLSVAILIVVLKLWRADLRDALYYQFDGVYYLSMVKTVVETGWYYDNDRVGQIGGLNYRDFPSADGWLHWGLIKLLTLVVPDPFVVMNLFFLVGFPLTALTTLFVCRRIGFAYPVALSVSLLYTFAPYHLLRIGHPFLAAYYVVPLSFLLVIRVCQGELPFRQAVEGGPERWRFFNGAALGTVVIAALTGLGGVYYAFFTCFFLMVAALSRAWAERHLVPIASAALICGVVAVALLASLWPSIEYKLTHARNSESAHRTACESEVFALKIAQLVLPVTDHRFAPLRDLKARYNRAGTPLVNENDTASLGMIGTSSFFLLLSRLFLRGRGGGRLLDALACLTLAALLLAMIGGLGSVFSLLLSPWVRAYNRISIFIALFALLAVGCALQRLGQYWDRTPRQCAAFAALLVGLVILGLLDQTNAAMIPDYRKLKQNLACDRAFIECLEASAPHGALVFQLPYRPYPEAVSDLDFIPYELARPYLHSRHLRWTYGGLKGHLGDEWAKSLARLPIGEMVKRLAEGETAGILVDRNGFNETGNGEERRKRIESELTHHLGVEPLVSANGRDAYFDLAPYTARLRSSVTSAEWQRRRDQAQHPIVPLWRNGFSMEETFPHAGIGHWCSKTGELHLENTLSYPRTIRMRMQFLLEGRAATAPLRLSGLWNEEIEISQHLRVVERELTVPPGKHVIRMICDIPPIIAPQDPLRRRLVFMVTRMTCEEP
jgi:phosphoglycerol transferase